MADKRIQSVVIGPMPKSIFDDMPSVTATFEDGTVKRLFSFYPDEVRFTPEEFVGKTADEARALFRNKDLAYLRS